MAGEPATCFLCDEQFTDIKKLKFHLVLAHPKSHVCLFCIERKGWSNEFPSQVAYNTHYQEAHSGVIEERKGQREEQKREAREIAAKRREEREAERRAGPEQQRREQRACSHCPHFPVFESGYERDRHLVASHNYDTCRLCRLVGPSMEVMVHIATRHQDKLCHLCGSQSPLFSSKGRVAAHLANSHGQTSLTCPNCDKSFTGLNTWLSHFHTEHNCSGGGLRPMKRKRGVKAAENINIQEAVKTISGLRNDSHRDCHILSVLHLLSQTALPDLLRDCGDSSALSQFFEQYAKGSIFFPHTLLHHPASFGVAEFPDLPGDLLHLFLRSCPPAARFNTVIEWKFECPSCTRFAKTRFEDFLLRIKATESKSFEQHLNSFLTSRTCICGAACPSQPNVRTTGAFLFVELDRSCSSQVAHNGSQEFELSLYPLRLNRTYQVLGGSYAVFGTINLNLDYAEGGHYTVNLLLDNDEVMQIHEENVERRVAGPALDSTAVVVALRREEGPLTPRSESCCSAPLYDLNKANGDGRAAAQEAPVGNESKHEQAWEEEDLPEETHTNSGIPEFPETPDNPPKENIMLLGDNMRIYKNDDEDVVRRYRKEYERKIEKKLNLEMSVVKDVSLRSLGGQVLESKIYKVQSLDGSKKQRKKAKQYRVGVIDDEGAGAGEQHLAIVIPEGSGHLS